MNVKNVMKIRIRNAPTVQPTSSFVLPWIWAAVRPFLALKRKSDHSSVASTPTKMNNARTKTMM